MGSGGIRAYMVKNCYFAKIYLPGVMCTPLVPSRSAAANGLWPMVHPSSCNSVGQSDNLSEMFRYASRWRQWGLDGMEYLYCLHGQPVGRDHGTYDVHTIPSFSSGGVFSSGKSLPIAGSTHRRYLVVWWVVAYAFVVLGDILFYPCSGALTYSNIFDMLLFQNFFQHVFCT